MNKQLTKEASDKIAGFLKDRREGLNLTQESLAKSCGVKRQTIQKIEYGEFLPNLELFLILLQKLECNVEIKSIDGDFFLKYDHK